MDVVIRLLTERDLAEADRINRIAFGTFFGLPDPAKFRGDGDAVHGRFAADPEASFAAEVDGRLVGCGFCMDWGSVGILGPLTVDVDYWSQGVARALMPEMVALLDRRGHTMSGLFTHPQSPMHIRLYESYDFWMQRPTAVMEKTPDPALRAFGVRLYSDLSGDEQEAALRDCRAVADTVYPGLDLTREIVSLARQGYGDTLLLDRDGAVAGFAVCHHGAMSEAGSGQLVVKFGAVRLGVDAPGHFRDLLLAAEGLAAARGAPRLVCGTNTGRIAVYRIMLDAGFRTFMNGIAMLRPGSSGYNVPEAYVIDDWR